MCLPGCETNKNVLQLLVPAIVIPKFVHQYREIICSQKEKKDSGLRPFQEYFTYIKLIVNQKWAKTGVPGEKPPDLPVQNLASLMYSKQGLNHSGERANV